MDLANTFVANPVQNMQRMTLAPSQLSALQLVSGRLRRGSHHFCSIPCLRFFMCQSGTAMVRRTDPGSEMIGNMAPGSIMVMSADSVARIELSAPVEGHWIIIDSVSAHKALNTVELAPARLEGGVLALIKDPLAEQIISRMIDDQKSRHRSCAVLQETMIPALLMLTVQALDGLSGGRVNTHEQVIDQVLPHIEKNLDQPLQLDDLAALASCTTSHLHRVFKEHLGETPYQYVLKRRLAKAKSMLQDSKAGIAEIAYACGFSSQSHLTDRFHRWQGVPPGRYRSVFARMEAA